MIKVSSDVDRVLVAKVHEAAQDQVFDHWDRLTPEDQASLLAQLHAMNLPLVRKLIVQYLQGTQEILEGRVLQAAPLLRVPETTQEMAEESAARARGEEALRKARVGLITAAGESRPGEEARAAFGLPRGAVPVGPVSGKSLFQLHAEKVRALCRRYRAALPWVIATSPGNHGAILAHFKEHEWFGLNRAEVMFLVQDELPVVNRRGKILLAEAGRIALCPNGHGGVLLRLLADEEVFHSLEVREIEHLFYFQVDNPLVRIADPAFLGHHLHRGCELSSKTVRKSSPEEKVGIFCQFNGSVGVVEHRELSEEDRNRREPCGRLEFSAGNVAIHIFSMELLRRLRSGPLQLPYHFVERRTPYIDRKGSRVVPRSPNSIGFECFIFDALPLARSALVMETRREEEFSPVKSQSGENSVATARRDLSRLHARWLREAGARVQNGAEDHGRIEISSLFALDAEELKTKLTSPPDVSDGFYLE